MKKWLQKRLKNEKGLTLVELLAVVVILGIIAAIAIPTIGNIVENSREKAIIADAQNVLAAANLYFIENPEDSTVTLTGTPALIPEFLDDSGTLSEATVSKDDDGLLNIKFKGTSGSKAIDESTDGLTKAELSDYFN